MKEIHALVSGFVQGVSFRYYAQMHAKRLDLAGYARNMLDGKVEVVAQGRKEDLEKFVEWLQHGPNTASVTDINVKWPKPSKAFKGFSIR